MFPNAGNNGDDARDGAPDHPEFCIPTPFSDSFPKISVDMACTNSDSGGGVMLMLIFIFIPVNNDEAGVGIPRDTKDGGADRGRSTSTSELVFPFRQPSSSPCACAFPNLIESLEEGPSWKSGLAASDFSRGTNFGSGVPCGGK